jgi:hypothetical protein
VKRTATILSTALMLTAGAAYADCEALSRHGVYDLSLNISETDQSLAFRRWFCQQSFRSEQEARDVGLDIGYGDFDLGYDQSRETWDHFYSSYCSDESFNSRFLHKTLSFVKRINPIVVKALQSCLIQKGLHAWIEQRSDMGTFRFLTIYNPSGSKDALPKVQTFYIEGGSCEGALREGDAIGPDGTELLCWRDGDGVVEILFDADKFVNKDTPLTIGPIVRELQPPARETMSFPVENVYYILKPRHSNNKCIHVQNGPNINYHKFRNYLWQLECPSAPVPDYLKFRFRKVDGENYNIIADLPDLSGSDGPRVERCFQVRGGNLNPGDGSEVFSWDCETGKVNWWRRSNFQFRFHKVDTDTYEIIADHSNLCLQVRGKRQTVKENTELLQADCDGGPYQRFLITPAS